jgi:hypothetical protein
VDLEVKIRLDHPLRYIQAIVNEARAALGGAFAPSGVLRHKNGSR